MTEHDTINTGIQPADAGDPSPSAMWMIGFIGAVLVIVISLGLVALYDSAKQEERDRKIYRQPAVAFENLRQQQLAELTREPHWVEMPPAEDEDGETERRLIIPIDRAMDRIVDEYGGEQTAMK